MGGVRRPFVLVVRHPLQEGELKGVYSGGVRRPFDLVARHPLQEGELKDVYFGGVRRPIDLVYIFSSFPVSLQIGAVLVRRLPCLYQKYTGPS